MGGIISRLKGTQSKTEILESLDKDIEKYKDACDNTERRHKKVVRYVMLYTGFIYILGLFLVFIYFKQISFPENLLLALPVIGGPIGIWCLVQILHCYYRAKQKRSKQRLQEFESKKKGILTQVKDTETYTKATEILEKFDPEFQRKKEVKFANEEYLKEMEIRHRINMATPVRPRPAILNTPSTSNFQPPRIDYTPAGRRLMPPPSTSSSTNNLFAHQLWGSAPKLSRPILSKDRSMLDKFMDYIVGDGPGNRFALLCSACHGHNGMALREEFEFLSFVCCYCQTLNPSRKQRPFAPKLQNLPAILPSPDEPPKIDLGDSACEDDTSICSEHSVISEPKVESPPSPTPSMEEQEEAKQQSNNGGTVITEYIDDPPISRTD